MARRNVQKTNQFRFHNRVILIRDKILQAVADNDRTLRGCGGLFTSTPQVTRGMWRDYVGQLDMEETSPGIQGLGFAQRVSPLDIASHVQRIQAEGFASYSVQPPGDRAEYFPVIYLEPFRDRNLRAFGYDMFSEPVRRAAMEFARDHDQTTLSGMVTLVQEVPDSVLQHGFLIYRPVYSADVSAQDAPEPLERLSGLLPVAAASASIEARRRSLLGFAYMPVRFGDFFDRLFSHDEPWLGISVYDGPEAEPARLAYDFHDNPKFEQVSASFAPAFLETVKMPVYGRTWTVKFVSLPSFEAVMDMAKPWYVLVLGVLASIFLWGTASFLESRRSLQRALELNLAQEKMKAELDARLQAQTADLEEANRVLRLSERNLKEAQALAHIGNWIVNPTTGETSWSEEMFRIAGRSVSHPAPSLHEVAAMFGPEGWQRAQAAVERAITDGKPVELDLELRRPDGTIRWVHATECVRKDSLGSVLEWYGTNQDITELKSIQDELRRREAEYRELINHMQAAVMVYSAGGKSLFCNSHASEILRVTPEQMVGRSVREIGWSLFQENKSPMTEAENPLSRVLASGQPVTGQVMGISPANGGEILWLQVNAFPEFDDQRNLVKVVVVAVDITTLKRAEEELHAHRDNLERLVAERTDELKAAKERYRLVIERTGQVMYEEDLATGTTIRAGAIEELTGFSLDEFGHLLKEQVLDTIHPDDRDRVLPQIMATTRAPGTHSMEYRIRRKDGTFRCVIDRGVSFAGPDGQVSQIIGTVTDVSERKQFEDSLRLKNAELEEANRAKSTFVANVSHEIRTPLNAIIGFADLALKTGLNQKQADYLGKIHLSGLSLLATVNDILDFSKIAAGKLTMETIEFSLDDVVNRLAAMIGPSALAKNLTIIINVPFTIPKPLIGDPTRLSQVLTNLLGNAVKFTEHGEIELTASHRRLGETTVELQMVIRDTGIGVPSDELAGLFQPFSQAGPSTARRFGGTGLGLSISKRLVELMGGKIQVESEAGKGTSVSFTAVFQTTSEKPAEVELPTNLRELRILVLETHPTMLVWFRRFFTSFPFTVDLVASPREALAAVEKKGRTVLYDLFLIDSHGLGPDVLSLLQHLRKMSDLWNHPKVILLLTSPTEDSLREQALRHGVSEFLLRPVTPTSVVQAIINIFEKPNPERVTTPAKTADDLDLEGLSILLVEDNPMNQQLAQELLESAGITVQIVSNGLEAVELLSRQVYSPSYDAILMDIQMPVMDGYEATRRIRQIPRSAATPIIAMTAHAMAEERSRVAAAGMNDHVAKPVIPKDLFQTLRRWTTPKSAAAPSVVSPSPRPPAVGDLPPIPGVNIQEGVARIGGNVEAYLRLLGEFPAAQQGELQKIGQACAAQDLERARALIHTLRGLAGNLSINDLFRAAGALNDALREPDWAAGNRLLPDLQDEFRRFSEAIAAWNLSRGLSSIRSPGGPGPVGPDSPSANGHSSGPAPGLKTMPLPRVRELLGELKTRLLGNNPQARQILAELVGFAWPDDCAADFATLEVAIGQFEFEQALQILSSIERNLK